MLVKMQNKLYDRLHVERELWLRALNGQLSIHQKRRTFSWPYNGHPGSLGTPSVVPKIHVQTRMPLLDVL